MTGKLIGIYSGADSPGKIVSSGNQIFIKMKTGKSVTTKGFEASYEKGENTLFTFVMLIFLHSVHVLSGAHNFQLSGSDRS